MQFKRRTTVFVYGLLALTLVCGAIGQTLAQGPEGKASPEQLAGKPAPTFKLNLLGGGEMDLAKHLKKDVVVLDFWASWCPPCRVALPKLVGVIDEYQAKLKDRKDAPALVFYGVNLNDPDEMLAAFMEQSKLKFNVALDKESTAAKAYLVSSIPQSVIIGADGMVKAVHLGLGPDFESTLRKDLDAALGLKAAESK